MKPTAVVTGGSKGLGEVIATFLARTGYDVVITGRSEEALARTAKRIGVRVVAGDVSDPNDRKRLADNTGDVAILVNNASELGTIRPLVESEPDELRRIFDVNVIAPIALVQALRPGLVVNITSDAAVGAYEGWGGYGSSKAALELVSRTLAAEGIHSVTVDPGDMRTDMHQAAFPGEDISDRPAPDITIPFWAWLFQQDAASLDGRRFQAQGERWEEAS